MERFESGWLAGNYYDSPDEEFEDLNGRTSSGNENGKIKLGNVFNEE